MFARNPISGSHPQGNLRVRQGRDLWFGEAPDATKIAPCPVGSVGLMGADYSDLCFDPIIAEGDAVALGQTLCTDRHQPSITLVAPCAGRVESITRGARRRLKTLVITPEGERLRFAECLLEPFGEFVLSHVRPPLLRWL